MMKKTYSLLLATALLGTAASSLQAQELFKVASPDSVSTVTADDGSLFLSIPFRINGAALASEEVIRVTPVVTGNGDPDHSLSLKPILVMGEKREILTERMQDARREVPYLTTDSDKTFVVQKGDAPERYLYQVSVPASEWTKDASLKLVAESWGCAACKVLTQEKRLTDRLIREPYVPDFKLAYITPPVEPVKARADKHTATFNFKVARHELLRNYKNNGREFAQVDRIVGEVAGNPDFTITSLTIDGYASPEDYASNNLPLSDRRAKAFADYLSEAFDLPSRMLKPTGHGEDWDGLRKAVEASAMAHKEEVLRIIDTEPGLDARDGKIRAIDGGKTYKLLLDEYYPPLRRTEYTIAYNVRAFTVEEGREIIKKDPKLLSLNEMYLVAGSYPKGSKEFNEVFDIAVRLYPDQPIAIINAASAEIEAGAYASAIARLEKLPDDAAALNNLAVAYALSGDDARAKAVLEKAQALGSAEAAHNLEELGKK